MIAKTFLETDEAWRPEPEFFDPDSEGRDETALDLMYRIEEQVGRSPAARLFLEFEGTLKRHTTYTEHHVIDHESAASDTIESVFSPTRREYMLPLTSHYLGNSRINLVHSAAANYGRDVDHRIEIRFDKQKFDHIYNLVIIPPNNGEDVVSVFHNFSRQVRDENGEVRWISSTEATRITDERTLLYLTRLIQTGEPRKHQDRLRLAT